MGVLGGFVYGAVYVAATLLMVPGSVLTIGAAYLFGFAGGLAVVWPSATAAAALGFLGTRYVARDRVEKYARRHPKFDALDAAIGKNGWKVVGLVRCNAIVPFALSNYLFGLTPVRFWPFLATSSLGILPGTLLLPVPRRRGKEPEQDGGAQRMAVGAHRRGRPRDRRHLLPPDPLREEGAGGREGAIGEPLSRAVPSFPLSPRERAG